VGPFETYSMRQNRQAKKKPGGEPGFRWFLKRVADQ
jgi:hypothetical protein